MKKLFKTFFVCFLFVSLLNGQNRVVIEITTSPEIKKVATILIGEKKDSFWEEFANQLLKDLNNSDWFDIKATEFKDKFNINIEMDSVLLKYNANFLIVCNPEEELSVSVYDTKGKSKIVEFNTKIGISPVELAHTVCDEIVFRLTGKPGIAKSKILYMTAKNNIHYIVMADSDGSNPRNILATEYIINFPRWFPGMTKIVFFSYRKTFPTLDLIDLKTKNIETFIAEPGLNACISFFKNQPFAAVVLSRSGNPDIYTVDLNGKIVKKLTEKKGINASPSVSPDGEKIAFVSDRDGKTRLWVMNSSGLNQRRLDIPSNYITSPCWSPDGKYLAYASRYGTEMYVEVYEWETGKRKVLTEDISWSDAPSWAPDSRHILFTRQEKYQNSLWVVDIYTLKKKKIVENAWSSCWDIR